MINVFYISRIGRIIKRKVYELAEKTTDRRTLKTRKALCNALAELLTRKQLHKVTVQEIADLADVNRVTFYKHYLDVYDLYEKIEEDTLIELGLLMLRLVELPTEEFFSDLMSYVSDNRVIFKMIFSPNSTGQLRIKLSKLIEGVFKQIQKEKNGVDINDTELSYMCCYRAQGCIAVIAKWIQGDFKESQEMIVKHLAVLDVNTQKLFDSKPKK